MWNSRSYSPDCLHVSFDSSDVDEVVDAFLLRKLLLCVLSLLALLELLLVVLFSQLLLLFSSWFSLATLSSSSTGSPFLLMMSTSTSIPCKLEATAWKIQKGEQDCYVRSKGKQQCFSVQKSWENCVRRKWMERKEVYNQVIDLNVDGEM